MARTFTVKKSGGTDYSPGWKLLTISKAKYDDYNGTQCLDMWFEGYPDSFNARVYATTGSNGEEFAIGQVFRFANAGITSGLEGPEGIVIKMDDNPSLLVGQKLNGYFYKDGEYTRVLKQFAPTIFTNEVETFQEKDTDYWKASAEKYYNNFIRNKEDNSNGFIESTTEKTASTTTTAYTPVNEDNLF